MPGCCSASHPAASVEPVRHAAVAEPMGTQQPVLVERADCGRPVPPDGRVVQCGAAGHDVGPHPGQLGRPGRASSSTSISSTPGSGRPEQLERSSGVADLHAARKLGDSRNVRTVVGTQSGHAFPHPRGHVVGPFANLGVGQHVS